MTRKLFVAVLITALIGPLALSQKPETKKRPQRSKKQGLEEVLARALESSPEILLARARLQQAEAELLQARAKVARQVLEHYARKKSLGSKLESAMQQYKHARALFEKGTVTSQELMFAEQKLVEYKSELSSLEIMEKYLNPQKQGKKKDGPVYHGVIGLGGGAGSARGTRGGKRTRVTVSGKSSPPAGLQKRLDEGLGRNVTGTTLADCVKGVFKMAPDVVCVYDPDFMPEERAVEIAAGKLTRRAALAALADIFDVVFVVREYGLYVTTPIRAADYTTSITIPASVRRDR